MAHVDDLRQPSGPTFPGKGAEIALLERKYRPYDFASVLESVMAIEAISSAMPRASSEVIEDELGMVKERQDGPGRVSSGRIAKSRRGDHGLDAQVLQRLIQLKPRAWPWCNPFIWELMRSGQLPMQDEEVRYNTFSEQVHKLLHVRTMMFGIQRVGSGSFQPVTLHHLRCLVMVGTLDAIAALWMLLIQAVAKGSDDILVIASHIPPALAMFYRRPEGQRTAVLLFARMRQLILDRVRTDVHELSLCRYDLPAVANRAMAWTLPALEIPHHSALHRKMAGASTLSRAQEETIERMMSASLRKRRTGRAVVTEKIVTLALTGDVRPAHRGMVGLPEVPSDVVEWIECSRAPLRRIGRRSAKVTQWVHPAQWPLALINQPHSSGVCWEKKAVAMFKEELGDYLCAGGL
ncbi:hypothetical protein ACFO8R_01300 [Dyella koreensis]|uniref:Uncharacterized protein n=2 Tax=Dyella koreensis TaxID=311235 RepID=A0ABW8K824_9GAMM